MSEFILETQDLTKEFKGFTAVDSVNLRVQRGHIHALLGPNGAGKTTIFYMITGLVSADRGTISLDGHE
ncbi:MAG: ATP-binding cassette domain-containing protein, partial [Proteobacteria bacterium]|nr:ATP-binding cassette domain-containing protein [Pseudomonadota bacterium]